MTDPRTVNVTDHDRTYWQYEYDVCAHYIIPLMRRWGIHTEGASVLDVGCGEGGGLCAIHDAGGACAGFDLEESRIRTALALRGDRPVTFAQGDLYAGRVPFSDREFDLVTLHDVFEHLEQKPAMIARLRGFLAPGGKLLVRFPPYYSAYGGHQQHLRTWYARLPFFHVLPFSASRIIPRLGGESPTIVSEIGKIGRLKMGMGNFERIAARGGMRIDRRRAYIVGPNHIRYGLKPLPAGPLAAIPLLRELACSGVIYLLSEG